MRCPNCSKDLRDDAKYCIGCGKQIPRCPTCGRVIQRRARFCVADGTPIPEEINALLPEGEQVYPLDSGDQINQLHTPESLLINEKKDNQNTKKKEQVGGKNTKNGKNKHKALTIIASMAFIILLLIAGYFTIHIWTEATCVDISVCKICGKKAGEALGHTWEAADCTAPKTCIICGTTSGEALGHDWQPANCTTPQTCSVCGETTGNVVDHQWTAATCTVPQTCSACGETTGDVVDHQWTAATCTAPQTCSVCGTTTGDALEHQWVEATYTAPKTCEVCGTTTGEKLQNQPIYINELRYQNKYGKVYYHDNQSVNYENNNDWRDLNTPGHIQRVVCDGDGNVFTYGLHMDGNQLGPYYITYSLDSKYTIFSGWCVLPDYKVNTDDAKTYGKYFEVYCDGALVFTSNTMRNGSASQFFEIDVTNVNVLTIQYAPTTGPNDLAVLCDGLLQ